MPNVSHVIRMSISLYTRPAPPRPRLANAAPTDTSLMIAVLVLFCLALLICGWTNGLKPAHFPQISCIKPTGTPRKSFPYPL